MIHDQTLIDHLSGYSTQQFASQVFRATGLSQDPLAPSARGGRWSKPNDAPVLYTSLDRDGALAEAAFRLSQFNPLPTKPVALHRLSVEITRTLRLTRADLERLGVETASYESVNYTRTQDIGAVVAWLGHEGLRVPSARWPCENLVLMMNNIALDVAVDRVASEEVDWIAWARERELLPKFY